MVGLLIKIGENKISPESVEKIIEEKDRTKASKTAPAEGLYLVDVEFEHEYEQYVENYRNLWYNKKEFYEIKGEESFMIGTVVVIGGVTFGVSRLIEGQRENGKRTIKLRKEGIFELLAVAVLVGSFYAGMALVHKHSVKKLNEEREKVRSMMNSSRSIEEDMELEEMLQNAGLLVQKNEENTDKKVL